MAAMVVKVTLSVIVRNRRALREEVYRRCPQAKGEKYDVPTLVRILFDDAERLDYWTAGVDVADSDAVLYE